MTDSEPQPIDIDPKSPTTQPIGRREKERTEPKTVNKTQTDRLSDVEYLSSKLRGSFRENSHTMQKPFEWRPGYKETGEKILGYHPIWAEDK